MRNVCCRDPASARLLLLQVGRALADRDESLKELLADKLERAVTEGAAEFQDRTAAAAVLELCKACGVGVGGALADKIVLMCRNLGLESLGVLLLEFQAEEAKEDVAKPQAKRRRGNEEDGSNGDGGASEAEVKAWMAMVDLHKSSGDFDSARGASSKVDSSDSAAILAEESQGNWQQAAEKSKSLIAAKKEGSSGARAAWESYLNALENLSSWGELADGMPDKIGSDKPDRVWSTEWSRGFLLPKLVRAETHNMVEGRRKSNVLFGLVDRCRNDAANSRRFEQFRQRFGQELTLLYLLKGKAADAKVSLETTVAAFLQEWSATASSSQGKMKAQLARLKRLSQLDRMVWAAASESDSGRRRTSRLLTEWRREGEEGETDFSRFASIQDCHDLVRDRAVGMQGLIASGKVDSSVWNLSIKNKYRN